jgi:subtilisin family serine protease
MKMVMWITLATAVVWAASAATEPARRAPTRLADPPEWVRDLGRRAAAPRRAPKALSYPRGDVVVIADAPALESGHGGSVRARDARLASALADLGLGRGRRLDAGPPARSKRRERIWLLSSDRPGFDPVAASRALQATGAVRAACPDYRLSLLYTLPADPFVFYQWYVDDGGLADVGLPFAWDFERGDTSVVIAIMDTGVDTQHPDFAGQIWRNPGETPGNSIDDDGNGLVDDVEGWDFGSGDADPKPEYTLDVQGIDVGFHGTFCAGVAAAATDNGEGIAGAGWRSRIMPLKISDTAAGFPTSAIAPAFAYAADQGASVLSMSFGEPDAPGLQDFYQVLIDMATYAGTMCVAAAGNDADSTRFYPAACNNVLAVAATDFDEARASFSNFGSWVDVAAPGSLMWSSICRNYQFTFLDSLIYVLAFGWDTVNPYMYGDGTSFACPLTAGIAGLVRSRYPYLTPQAAARHLIATGETIAFDQPIGPKVNAFQAVTAIPTAVVETARAPDAAHLFAAPNPLAASGEIRFAVPAAGRVRLTIHDASGRLVRTLFAGQVSSGPRAAPWDGLDDRGAPLATGVYFARLERPGGVSSLKVVHLGR